MRQPIMADRGQTVRRVIDRDAPQIALTSIREFADDPKLQFIRRRKKNLLLWRDTQAGQFWCGIEVVLKPSPNPIEQSFVFLRFRFEPLAPFVRDLGGGFQQDQAPLRFQRIRPPPERFARENVVIELRILATQRQLEPSLPALITVALPR